MKNILVLLSLCCLAQYSTAQTTPTWASDIAPILYDHCVSCHRAGGVGGFSLETWTDAKNKATSMLYNVETRYMPPWRALPSYRHFKDENYLSDEEIQTIADWVNGSQLAGNLADAPPLPNFQNGSQLTSVDMVLETPQFTINKQTDIYRAFVIPTGVTSDKFFNEVEFMPGNDAIIHHIVVYTDPTNEPVLRDQADPGPGFTTNGMVGNITANASLIGEWTPGGTTIKMPPNFGYRIPANGYFIVEIHFAPGHLNETDEGTVVNLHLSGSAPRELYYTTLTYADSLFGLINPPFLIPANTIHTLSSTLKVSELAPAPISVFTLTPHAHVFGKSFKAYAYRQGTTDTIPLIEIPKWDFYWQGTYTMQKPLRLNTNYTCRADVTYDNTSDNPNNPFFPPQDVRWGEKTTNEMLFLFATVALYKTGDENIVLDSALLTSSPEIVVQDDQFIIPNPLQDDVLDIRTKAPLSGIAELILSDMNGVVQRQWREQNLAHSRTSVANLVPGVYVLQIRQQGRVSCFKLLKM
ncbi:MAG: T9SS type A sorting domain-containing protein [Saprospiraceae bacterium]